MLIVDISLILLCMGSEQIECRLSDLLKIFLPSGKTVSNKNETVVSFPVASLSLPGKTFISNLVFLVLLRERFCSNL